jgi:hypothetical protein
MADRPRRVTVKSKYLIIPKAPVRIKVKKTKNKIIGKNLQLSDPITPIFDTDTSTASKADTLEDASDFDTDMILSSKCTRIAGQNSPDSSSGSEFYGFSDDSFDNVAKKAPSDASCGGSSDASGGCSCVNGGGFSVNGGGGVSSDASGGGFSVSGGGGVSSDNSGGGSSFNGGGGSSFNGGGGSSFNGGGGSSEISCENAGRKNELDEED